MVEGASQDVLTDLLKNPETLEEPILGGSIPNRREHRCPRVGMRSGVEQRIDRHGPSGIAGSCSAQRVVDEACSHRMATTERLESGSRERSIDRRARFVQFDRSKMRAA